MFRNNHKSRDLIIIDDNDNVTKADQSSLPKILKNSLEKSISIELNYDEVDDGGDSAADKKARKIFLAKNDDNELLRNRAASFNDREVQCKNGLRRKKSFGLLTKSSSHGSTDLDNQKKSKTDKQCSYQNSLHWVGRETIERHGFIRSNELINKLPPINRKCLSLSGSWSRSQYDLSKYKETLEN